MAKSAGFLGKQHADKTREKIKVTQIVNRLNKYANGELTDDDVSSGQIKAMEILLRKALPDLSSVSYEGQMDMNHAVNIKLVPIDGSNS